MHVSTRGRIRKKALLLYVAAACALAALASVSGVTTLDASAASRDYSNPVYNGNAGDPAVFRAGGAFYVYTTQTASDGTGPHLPVLRSDDLVDWTYVGDALPALPDWALEGPNRDTWAPHVIEHNGRYQLYYSARHRSSGDMAIGVAVADVPAGPFTPIGQPLIVGDSIDPFIMKTPSALYMYWMKPRTPIRVQRLSADGTKLVGSPATVLRPAPKKEYEKLIEGPWVERKGDYYYLFYSGNHCCAPNPHYALMVARSKNPRGLFTRFRGNPILEANERFVAPGHNSVLKDDAGKYWTLYHAMRRGDSTFERVLMLDRIRWFNEWPRINGGNGPSGGQRTGPEVNLLGS
jgi:arabinan endo-1,5-alpha-L-arabinosidase